MRWQTAKAASDDRRPPNDPAQNGEIAERRERVDAFVQRHFTWPGTLRLHRAALGLDILRAPLNVMMSPVFALVRISAWICRRLGLVRTADCLQRRRLLLRTAVSAEVEAAILTDLLDVSLPAGGASHDRAALCRAILAALRFREALRRSGTVAGAQATADRMLGAIGDYTGTRSAVAEFTTALLTLATGAIVFQALTPGMISMAPGVAEVVSRSTAIADFPLGTTLGGVWYGVFPVGPSPGLMAVTVAGLMLLGSVAAAFAGVIADPLQALLGSHRRRLLRLLDTLDAETSGARDKPFVAQEHFLVRVFDLWDMALSLLRAFRS